MIDVELLKNVKTVVTHEGCADGVASALILKDALPDARVVFVRYDTPTWKGLADNPEIKTPILFCDMTPCPDDVDAFVNDDTIVLDHHRGARELVAKFGDRGVFADEEAEPGVSGALLAFREVWDRIRFTQGREPSVERTVERVRDFAVLVGIRDTWQRSSPRWREACAQAAALCFWPWEDLECLSLTGDVFASRLDIGPVLLRKEAERVERAIKEAYRFKLVDLGPPELRLRCAVFEGLDTSDVIDALEGEVDLVLGWHYSRVGDRPVLHVSARSRGRLTALALARRYGGGGHDRAAGFTLDLWRQPALSPYDLLEWVVGEAVST